VPPFSEDLQKLQSLEERYREQLSGYETELTTYRALLDRDPNDPDVARRYDDLDSRNRALQETYREMETLRRSLSPSSGISRSA
jgi:hypothetical protein